MATTIPIVTGITASSNSTGVWNNLLIVQSVLNADNPVYLRTLQINNNMLILTRGGIMCGIPLSSLIPLFIAVQPTLTWPPKITTQPSSRTVAAPDATGFSVVATSEIAITYAWQISTDAGANYTNLAADAIYSDVATADMGISDSTGLTGNYYRCVLTNASGVTNSSAAVLTVTT